MPNRTEVIAALPKVQGKRETLSNDQDTKDIIVEVLKAHSFFAPDYDKIAGLFDGEGRELYEDLFDFCKKNVKYVIESHNLQTTRSPGALLNLGYGDCKHYAGFIGGILDAKNRAGNSIDWFYRFASYKFRDRRPQHVFVVVRDGSKEYWIDPVVAEFNMRSPSPYYHIDKKPSMLQRIYGIGNTTMWPAGFKNPVLVSYNALIFGPMIMSNQILYPTRLDLIYPIRYFVDGELFTGFPTIQAYKLREQGKTPPMPPQGLTVEYPATWLGKPVPADMLRPYISPEGKMYIATPQGNLYDFPFVKSLSNPLETANSATNKILIADNNRLLNLLVAATGAIQMAYQVYPDAENTQRFYDTMLRMRDHNFLIPREIKTFAGNLIEGFKDLVQEIGKGFVKFIGIIPRQAFLLMCKLNVFNSAKNLDANIQKGKGPEIKKKWEGFGGDYGTLVNNINQGKTKNAILGENPNNIIGSVDGIGEMTVAAALAAAAPVIALLASYLKGIGGPEVDAMVDGAIAQINGLLTAAGEDPIGLSESLGGKTVTVTDSNGNTIKIPPNPGGGNSSGVLEWMKANPEKAALIGVGVVGGGLMLMSSTRRRRA